MLTTWRTCGSPVNEEAEGEMESTKMMNPSRRLGRSRGVDPYGLFEAEMVRVNR